MSYLVKTIAVLASLSLVATGCSKKSGKGTARPAGAAANAKTTGAPGLPPPADDDAPAASSPSGNRQVSPTDSPAEPSRFSESERRRADNSRYTRQADPEAAPPVVSGSGQNPGSAPVAPPEGDEVADAGPQPPLRDEPAAPSETSEPISNDPRCGTAYEHNSAKWAPGLPNPPSQTLICTGGLDRALEREEQFRCEGNREPVYTDARQDGMMALAVELFNAIPSHLDKGSRELARRLSDVKLSLGQQSVRVKFKFRLSQEETGDVELRGQGRGRGDSTRLQAVTAPGNYKFSGALTCADADGSCQNAMLRVHLHSRSGRVARVAYVVLRSGEAHVTMSEQDRVNFRSIQNRGHAQFAEYLSNTSYNTCAAVLREIVNGQRQLPACAYQRLKRICGRNAQFKQPSAQSFEFNSWAVAYGKSGFELEMQDREHTRFRVHGPLLASSQTPVHNRPLTVGGSFGREIKQAILVANDGGGNLNLQIDFNGDAHTRISVTTLIEDVRYNSEATTRQARRMRPMDRQEMVDEREWQEEAQERVNRQAAPVPPRNIPRTRPLPPPPQGTRPRASAPAPRPAVGIGTSARPAVGIGTSGRPAVGIGTSQRGAVGTGTSARVGVGTSQPARQAAPRAQGAPRPGATAAPAAPATPTPRTTTRPLPAPPDVAATPAPTPGSGPRFESAPVAPAPLVPPPGSGVEPRESEDNQVIQPRDADGPPMP